MKHLPPVLDVEEGWMIFQLFDRTAEESKDSPIPLSHLNPSPPAPPKIPKYPNTGRLKEGFRNAAWNVGDCFSRTFHRYMSWWPLREDSISRMKFMGSVSRSVYKNYLGRCSNLMAVAGFLSL
ncbi:hypothetical protein NMG60_11001800 [Bertholletia excelsa]